LDPQSVDVLLQLRHRGRRYRGSDPWHAATVNRRLNQQLGSLLQQTDVLFTDWADRSTVWATHRAPAGVRVVVRIHSVDALDPWFHLVDWTNVDQVIVVSEPVRRVVAGLFEAIGGGPPVTLVPNIVPVRQMDRPKEPSAHRTLGLVGWGRRVKDPLWALDLLARSPGWRLVLIGAPMEEGKSGLGAAYHEEVARRLDDPDIAPRVEVAGWTDDVASHLQRVGVILSTSRRESCPLGLLEGAASGAVPVVRDWPVFAGVGGARSVVPPEWVVSDLDEARERLASLEARDAWEDAGARVRAQAHRLFDPDAASQRYREVVLG
jgi:hypothetical protein